MISSLVAIYVYWMHPKVYSYEYNTYCLIHFFIATIFFFKYKKKKNYFDFDTIFLIAYFFTFFMYPVFIYPVDPYYFFIFNYGFNENVISQSTALSLLGSQMYMFGSITYGRRKMKKTFLHYYPVNSFIICSILFFLLFIFFGGYSYYKDLYAGNITTQDIKNSGLAYMNMLFWIFLLVALSLEFNKMLCLDRNKFQLSNVNKVLLIFIVIYIPLLLSTGTRGVSMQTLLIILGLYSFYYKPVSLKKMIPLVCLGTLGMFFISSTRGGGTFRIQSFMDMFMDLVINNRNTFVAVDYVQEHGVSYGVSMLGYILRTIPFAQGIVFRLFDVNPNETSSAMLLTVETLGENPSFGVGTNIIADLYLAFGAVGVIVFMFLGGYFVSMVQSNAESFRLNYIVMYAILLSLSIYTVRAEFFFSLYLLAWTAFILYFIKRCYIRKKELYA